MLLVVVNDAGTGTKDTRSLMGMAQSPKRNDAMRLGRGPATSPARWCVYQNVQSSTGSTPIAL